MIIRRRNTGIRIYTPDVPVANPSTVQIRFETSGTFIFFPGIRVRAGIDFNWKNRKMSGTGLLPEVLSHGFINMDAERRGSYTSPGPYFLVSDLTGLCRLKLLSGDAAEVTVLPEKTGSAPLLKLITSGGDEISRRVRKKRNDILIESRQYYPGDDVRRLNWKAYAHTGELFIRLGEEVPLPESKLLIVPDPGGAESAAADVSGYYLDYLAACIAEIISELNERGISVDLALPGGRIITGPSEAALADLWWTSEPLPDTGKQTGSCLMVVSAFSGSAARTAAALAAGRPVYAVVPVPPAASQAKEPGLMERLFFTGSGMPTRPEGRRFDEIKRAAEKRCSELKEIRGVINAAVL